MGPLDLLTHWFNFVAPAFSVAVLVVVLANLGSAAPVRKSALVLQSAVNAGVCVAVMLAGLWLWGQDGKMATYCAMVLACATTQWLLQRRRNP